MSVWTEIQFAPKDGPPVDLWVKFIKNNELRFSNCVWTIDEEDEGHWYCRDRFIALFPEHGYEVTHYMEIPKGPNA